MTPSLTKALRIVFIPSLCMIYLVARFHHGRPYLQPLPQVVVTNGSVQVGEPLVISRNLTSTNRRTPYSRQYRVDNNSVTFKNICENESGHMKDHPFRAYDPLKPPVFLLKNDSKQYFVHLPNTTCFLAGTDLVASNVSCVCQPRWYGTDCSVPEPIWASQKFKRKYTNKSITRRGSAKRIVNALNINHELGMLDIRVHELGDVVDVFIVCESNYTAYGEPKPLYLLPKLQEGFLKEFQHKIVYVWLDHFPEGGKENGWIADSYLRTFLWQQGKKQISGLRDDDLFLLTDADEIPRADAVAFLKNYDGYGQPIFWRLRWTVFGFFWWNFMEHVQISAGCTMEYLREVLRDNAIKLRSGKLPKNATSSHRAMTDEWTVGQNRGQNGGWHCSWCGTVEGLKIKLLSAQKSDGVRWGDFPEKLQPKYLSSLVREGKWFNGKKVGLRCLVDNRTTPAYVLANLNKFKYMVSPPDEFYLD